MTTGVSVAVSTASWGTAAGTEYNRFPHGVMSLAFVALLMEAALLMMEYLRSTFEICLRGSHD